ncbi:MAG: S-layer homology domain-containing protein [Clostridia bacterium]|nr:S-layer homology domain-containing protein [Clostridia bacterium]
MKKFICLALALTFVLSCGAFASAAEAPSTENLGGYTNITNGDPSTRITRGDAVKMVCLMIAIEVQSSYDEAPFADVSATNANFNYICAAAENGIVVGYGDGNFYPDQTVTYEEAIKMIVCALGYGSDDALAGYPDTYIEIAEGLGIVHDVPYTIGGTVGGNELGVMLYYALDTPIMVDGVVTDVTPRSLH